MTIVHLAAPLLILILILILDSYQYFRESRDKTIGKDTELAATCH